MNKKLKVQFLLSLLLLGSCAIAPWTTRSEARGIAKEEAEIAVVEEVNELKVSLNEQGITTPELDEMPVSTEESDGDGLGMLMAGGGGLLSLILFFLRGLPSKGPLVAALSVMAKVFQYRKPADKKKPTS